MNLQEKSQEVRRVFDELDVETKAFLEASKLTCIPGCGFCCSNPKVNASVLEFLPLAFDLYDKGKAEKALEMLESKDEESFCIIYKSMSLDNTKGFCSDYTNRGLICRLFSSSSRKNKEGKKEIITCKKIKEGKKSEFEAASKSINEDLPIPLNSGIYNQLYNIDFQLTAQQLPINQAIKKAIEVVLTYKFYTENQEPEASENF
ncbi:YkgJ family cysteine cluster protein [Cecembia calidifontis]|uniref:Putative zinc-or iron-chelating protein n=1 Tax=Cecembia calidifontis TaxID=1187080 RepID=A0A4Q7P5W0_9BACT|nr:YkgJ family cysteine cluster protein [Cecembia calidifontis]RZS95137.1 putative zinc- or iron-chelating protein [Cecembia calidifontis]